MSPIIVEVGKQTNGATFRLSPRTETRIRSQVSSVFVSFERSWRFECLARPTWTHIVVLLTGFDEEEIRDRGGFRFLIPIDNEVVFESLAA